MKKPLLLAWLALPLLGCPQNSCIAAGSRVLTPSGWVPIEQLGIGDEVFAVNEETGELVATKVVASQSATREVGLFQVAGTTLRLTTDHPVYCPRDKVYAPAGDWFLGERTTLAMLDDTGLVQREVERVETYVEVTEVFDITVAHELHNFVVEGIVVHNKSIAQYDCELDGQNRFDGGSCDCPDGSTGVLECYPTPVCACGVEPNNGTTDVGVTDTGAADMSVSDLGAGDSGADVGGADAATGDAGADAGMQGRARGTCVDDADCGAGTCVSIPADTSGGYFTCQSPKPDAPNCGTIMAPDTCCVHEDCAGQGTNATCVAGPIFYCGGVAPIEANVCVADDCTTEADCGAEEVCVPAGTFGEPVARCVAAQCEVDGDCTAGTAGECQPFFDPCRNRFSGFFCTYEDSECRSDEDCKTGFDPYCAPGAENGDTSCQEFFPPP